MIHRRLLPFLVLSIALAGSFAPARADSLFGGTSYAPRVPVSALARPAFGLDPSRLHVSSMVSVGSGFGGGTNALQVTSLSYQFTGPLRMSVSLGNSWGAANARGSAMFLEGFDVAYQPSPSMLFRIQYQDVRSPLQWSGYSPYAAYSPSGYWGR